MFYRFLADLVVVLHSAFVLFVVLGGLFALRWPRAAWLHLPAAIWGAGIEFLAGICPLTPLENHLRRLGGEAGYSGGFVEHYVLPVLYPEELTRGVQLAIGTFVVVLNVVIYAVVWRRRALTPRPPLPSPGEGEKDRA
ncbi:MAG TPA: DUF2784 domain-containing protein [Thermoanaerobaculia bacterium]